MKLSRVNNVTYTVEICVQTPPKNGDQFKDRSGTTWIVRNVGPVTPRVYTVALPEGFTEYEMTLTCENARASLSTDFDLTPITGYRVEKENWEGIFDLNSYNTGFGSIMTKGGRFSWLLRLNNDVWEMKISKYAYSITDFNGNLFSSTGMFGRTDFDNNWLYHKLTDIVNSNVSLFISKLEP